MIDHPVPAAAFFARMLDTAGGGTLPTLPARAGIPPVSVLPGYPAPA